MDAVSLLQDLIRCKSVTPAEAGVLTLLQERLKALGFSTRLLTFSDKDTPDVTNLYARLGAGSPCLMFAGHTDVVPAGDESAWSVPPFSGTIANGRIIGRGACDMKGGVAAFVAAVAAYLKDKGPPPGSLSFLITCDEEGPAINGTPKVLQWMKEQGESFDHCILGEPSGRLEAGDRIKIGARGSFSARLVVTGKQGHVAYPEKANNPVPHLMRILQALYQPLDKGNAFFPCSNLEVTDLSIGNEADNVIPRSAVAKFNIRFCDDWTNAALEKEIRSRIEKAAEGVEWQLAVRQANTEAFRSDAGDFLKLVGDAIENTTGKRPAFHAAGGTSDARFIIHYGPVVEIGPAGTSLHEVDEYVEIDDLNRAVAIYRAILERYFASPL